MVVALVLGHSFVRRIRKYLDKSGRSQLNLTNVLNYVFYEAKGGGTLPDFNSAKLLQFISNTEPDIVLLCIGFNDLCSPRVHPIQFADSLVQFSHYLTNIRGVKSVLIHQICRRSSGWKPRDSQRSTFSTQV